MSVIDLDFDALPQDEAPAEDVITEPNVHSFICPECGKEAKNKRGLSMHMKRSHGIASDKDDAKPSSLRSKSTNLERDLKEFIGMIAMMVMMVNQTDGAIIAGNADKLAHAYANLARQNKAFRNFLEGMMKTGAIGEVFTATLITALPILGNHNKLPPEIMAFFGAPTVMEQE